MQILGQTCAKINKKYASLWIWISSFFLYWKRSNVKLFMETGIWSKNFDSVVVQMVALEINFYSINIRKNL